MVIIGLLKFEKLRDFLFLQISSYWEKIIEFLLRCESDEKAFLERKCL